MERSERKIKEDSKEQEREDGPSEMVREGRNLWMGQAWTGHVCLHVQEITTVRAMPHFSLAVAGGPRAEEAPISVRGLWRCTHHVTRTLPGHEGQTCGSPSLHLFISLISLTTCLHLAIICLTIYHIYAFEFLADRRDRRIYHQVHTILTWIRAIGQNQQTPCPRSHPLPISNLQMEPTW